MQSALLEIAYSNVRVTDRKTTSMSIAFLLISVSVFVCIRHLGRSTICLAMFKLGPTGIKDVYLSEVIELQVSLVEN